MIDTQCECRLVRPWPEYMLPLGHDEEREGQAIVGGGDISYIRERCEFEATQEDGLCDVCRPHVGHTWDDFWPKAEGFKREPRPGWRWERGVSPDDRRQGTGVETSIEFDETHADLVEGS